MMSQHQLAVYHFMIKAGQEVPPRPTVPSDAVLILRAKLILEEALETVMAMGINVEMRYTGVGAGGSVPINNDGLIITRSKSKIRMPDLMEMADGCADLSVVTQGTLLACGIEDTGLFAEVDKSNLAKFTGDAHRREDGKWQKPSDWTPPNIRAVLIGQGDLY